MEAYKLNTLTDLLASPEERVELIDGEIVRRPMARAEHGVVQHRTSVELGPFDRTSGPSGWWILTEVSVAYETHQCPCHDLAGWRKERMPERPRGVIELTPDWVCEIVSPDHEPGSGLYPRRLSATTAPAGIFILRQKANLLREVLSASTRLRASP